MKTARALGDAAVLTSSTCRDILPNDLTEVTKAELALSIADDRTVSGASAGTVG